MRGRKLACIAFEVVVLRDQRRIRGSRIGKDIRVWARTQPDIIGVFRFVAGRAQVGREACGKVLIEEEAPPRQIISRQRQSSS